ncbi:hypothetical protein ACHHYP_06651 [Achlya hypogyna]|uniref:Uncharacterized protein n=1 Tax=Achlya hypogyna TaxID=1202772 RepID=A0A1V9YSF6_ACHHY|nr:hypothetical protein ACHHYP_06651 [Achlya hypogyna]
MLTIVPSDLKCKYAYKACNNVRSLKKDGDHHTLCDYHRAKANSIQRIYATKRRQEKREQRKQAALIKKKEAMTLPLTSSFMNLIEGLDSFLLGDDDLPSQADFKAPSSNVHLRCTYAYKSCTNMRTFRNDGVLHTLCEFHRNKANMIQKTYATKRRQRLRALRGNAGLPPRPIRYSGPMEPIPYRPLTSPTVIEPMDLQALGMFLPEADEIEPTDVWSESTSLSDEEKEFLSELIPASTES